jgi:Protein of unknown function (DUF4231)
MSGAESGTNSSATTVVPADRILKVQDRVLKAQFNSYKRTVEAKLQPAQQDYWNTVWAPAVDKAFRKLQNTRKWFYSLQGASTAAAVIVPALVGLNLSGSGGVTVRWVTFAVGLIGALCSSFLQLFRFGSRWRLYRDNFSALLLTGRNYVTSLALTQGQPTQEAWNKFQGDVDATIANYDRAYDAEIISAVQPQESSRTSRPVDT